MLTLSALLIVAAAAAVPDTQVVPLPEVVVTGTRTSESQLQAPAAISVVQRRDFTDTRGISLKDALGYVPGVFIQSRAGAQDIRITIRGFGARGNGDRSNSGNIRGIRVMNDGLPLTEPDGRSSLDLVDLGSAGSIEVQRSNASSLFGNASGGVVNIRTDLSFADAFGEYRQRAGSFGYHREQGVVGFSAGSGRGTLSLLNSTFDGWRDHSASYTTLFQGRFSAPLDPTTRLGASLDLVTSLNRFPGALTQAELDADPSQANPAYVQRDERRDNNIGRVGLMFDKAVRASQNLSIKVYAEPKSLQRSERGRFRDFTRYHVGANGTYEVRTRINETLESRTAFGGDEAYQDGAILFYDVDAEGNRGDTLRANKREAANSAGAFVEQELSWQHWSARVAVRYDNMHYISEDRIDPVLNATKDFSHWTPKGSLSYRFEDHTVYASLGGGVEAPAFNEIDPPPPFNTTTSFNPFLEAMYSTTYEAGAKGGVPQLGRIGQVRYDAALYWIDVQNDIIPYDGGAYFLTAGKSRRHGVELGLDWLPVRGLLFETGATFSNNEYLEYTNNLGDFSGNDVAGLPSVTVSARAQYQAPRGFQPEIRLENVGSCYADDANTAKAPGYTIFGASLGYGATIGGTSLRAYVAGDNLTDKAHVASVFINGTGGRYYEPGLPRNWSAGLTFKFQ